MTIRIPVALALALAGSLACGDSGSGSDVPADVPADTPLDDAGDVPADTPADTPTDTPVDVPADVPVDVPADTPTDVPGDVLPEVCGPIPGGTCPGGTTCDIHGCGDGATGSCVETPAECPRLWDPVCGCDGITYANDCRRIVAGAALDHAGECVPVPDCGGPTGIECRRGQVCDIRGCAPELGGLCVPDPGGACPDIYAPVCGCDDRTYENDCQRLSARVALKAEGPCATSDVCGGIGGIPCARGEVCDIHGCGLDFTGVCVVRPDTCAGIYEPVCGCDGTTYGNDCYRLQADTPLDHLGACGTTDCAPRCETGGGPARWVNPCTGVRYCEADCGTCTAECRFEGTRSEGWYADCLGGVRPAGCVTGVDNLIAYDTTCG